MIESLERNYKRRDTEVRTDRLVKEAEQVHDDLSKQYQQFQNYEKSLIEEAKEKQIRKLKLQQKKLTILLKI